VDANSIVYTNKSNSTFYENYKEKIKLRMSKAKYKKRSYERVLSCDKLNVLVHSSTS
jgi:hypothetical protein